MGRTQLQCTKAFSFFFSSNADSLFQDLTRWKGKFVFKPQKVFWPKGVLAGALPGVTQRLETQLPDLP
jgi:hypothetical protein